MSTIHGTPDPDFVLRGHVDSVTSVSFDEDKGFQTLVSGSANGDIKLWDLRVRRPVLATRGPDSILGVSFLSNNEIISHSRDGTVQYLDVNSGLQINDTFSVGEGTFCPISLLKMDDKTYISSPSGFKSEVYVFDLVTRETLAKFDPQRKLGMVMQLKLFKNAQKAYLAVGYEDGSVLLWDIEEITEVAGLHIYDDPIMSLDIDELQMKATVGSATSKLFLVEFPKPQEHNMTVIASAELKTPGCGSVAFRPDKKLIMVGSWSGKISVFGGKRLKPLAYLKYHNETINSICFSPTFNFAAASKDCKISIWSVYRV